MLFSGSSGAGSTTRTGAISSNMTALLSGLKKVQWVRGTDTRISSNQLSHVIGSDRIVRFPFVEDAEVDIVG